MDADLHLLTYRREERELIRRLEHRRIAQERGGTTTSTGRRLTRGLLARGAGHGHRPAAALRSAGAWASGWLARGRHAVTEVSAPTACCTPA